MAQTLLHGAADPLPDESCIGALMNRLVEENEDFQPMNFNFGLLPHHEGLKKKNKKEILGEAARASVQKWIAERTIGNARFINPQADAECEG